MLGIINRGVLYKSTEVISTLDHMLDLTQGIVSSFGHQLKDADMLEGVQR